MTFPKPMMSGDDFLMKVVRPAISHMNMYSVAAEKLLYMTAAHESMGFRYNKQVNGPALSFFQIEPPTLRDVFWRYSADRPAIRRGLIELLPPDYPLPLTDEYLERALLEHPMFAAAIARVRYWMVPEALPSAFDEQGLAEYAKEHYNTHLGKATAQRYYDDYHRYAPKNPPASWTQGVS